MTLLWANGEIASNCPDLPMGSVPGHMILLKSDKPTRLSATQFSDTKPNVDLSGISTPPTPSSMD